MISPCLIWYWCQQHTVNIDWLVYSHCFYYSSTQRSILKAISCNKTKNLLLEQIKHIKIVLHSNNCFADENIFNYLSEVSYNLWTLSTKKWKHQGLLLTISRFSSANNLSNINHRNTVINVFPEKFPASCLIIC